jgi:hypothetical protein
MMYEIILPYIWVTVVFGDILTHMYSKFPTTQIIMEFEFNSHYLARNNRN